MGDSPSLPRVKRQKVDKNGRFAALEKLRGLKGQKNKVEVNENVDNVYDIVDEKEFAKHAHEKYCQDWIEDDGTGYLEDGRDFFEDEDENSDEGGKKDSKNEKKSKKRLREDDKTKGRRTIRSLFSNVSTKRKGEVKLEDDNILADILGEMNSVKKSSDKSIKKLDETENTPSNSATKEKDDIVAKQYMQNFMENIKRIKESKSEQSKNNDDKVIACTLEANNKEISLRDSKLTKNGDVGIVGKEPCKNIEEYISPKKNVNVSPKIVSPRLEKVCTTETNEDMDYSILNEDENQFAQESIGVENTNHQDQRLLESDAHLLNNWEKICNVDNFEEEMHTHSSETHDINREDLKVWYWDAWEDPMRRPGQVFLFGKMQGQKEEYKSVCVQIENINRCLYLLPREYVLDPITKRPTDKKVAFIDVYNEFNDVIANELGISCFRSKTVIKNFAFIVPSVDIPESCEYLEVRYTGKQGVPDIKRQYNTISYIFGTNSTALETFLLECKIKGPCWLNIKSFRLSDVPLSWCKLEVKCASQSSISVAEERNLSPPPMTLLVLNTKTALNAKTMKNEVVIISCLVSNNFGVDRPPKNVPFERHFCGFTRPVSQNWPLDINQKLLLYKSTQAKKLESERALLSWFLASYQHIDPDIIVTHDANDCQLDVLCDRVSTLKIPLWSRLGRLRISQVIGKRYKDFFIGRLICDVKQSAEELIKSRSYDLDTLCLNVLKIKEGERIDITNDELYSMYETSDGLTKLISLTMQDSFYMLKLMCELNVLPLALQITNICGNLMSRTLQGGRSERNEFLLLHAFYEKNFIVPDKKTRENNWEQSDVNTHISNAGRKKASYSGGLVLDPIKGFYDKYILLMDFNSLYPSIIQEYNICFTTISKPTNDDVLPTLPESNTNQGVLPRQIRRLVESRREVKKLMSNSDLDADLKTQYNIRQLALKLTANSMYGCLGFSNSRFFAQHLAALITHKGREILMNTKSLVQKLNYEVIYGDTDSIMINTNSTDYDQVFKVGHNIKQIVNKIYKQIELDIDGVFKYLLLLKKKKYAAVCITKSKRGEFILNQEHKGLDIVRRDWSQISVMAGKAILDEILSEKQLDEKTENIHLNLENFRDNILNGSVPLQLLTITKQLTKSPKDYATIGTLPHVQVALRMNSTKNKRYKKGDMVSYIICDDGTENPAMQRAYHIDELKLMETLKVDTNYYLAQQIHPVVSRLCEPLEGTDASKIANCLGLDPSKFKVAAQKVHRERTEEDTGALIIKSALQKFRQCEKFTFKCISCKKENIVASAFKPAEKNNFISALQKCANIDCTLSPYQYISSIKNELILAIRKRIRRFYDNWMVCDDPSCNSNTRIYSHIMVNNRPICLSCKQGFLIRQYSERDLFNQLSYYQYMFDLTKHAQKSNNLTLELERAYNTLKETIDYELERSAYCIVSLSRLFPQVTQK